MARRTFGPISDLFDLKGRRLVRGALARALPEMDERQRDVVLRQSLSWQRRRGRCERRSHELSPVKFCRQLTFEGWENLHNAADESLFLVAPLGSVEVARRVLDLYHAGHESAQVVPPPRGQETVSAELFRQTLTCSVYPARQALRTGASAIWILALPNGKNRWAIHYQPPIPPLADDTGLSLSRRYLNVLDEVIRRHPDCWPWKELC